MEKKVDKKIILGNLISHILEDESNLGDFVFFLNRLENIHRPIDEIQSVLNDYLSICNGISVKGKKRVRHIYDRHELHCELNIGFIEINKIEIIANALLNETGVKLPITIHDFKRRYKNTILRNNELGEKYRGFINNYRDGDEILEVVSSRQTWKQSSGQSFVALQRNGEQIMVIVNQ